MSTFGIEEEFFLLDRETGLPTVPDTLSLQLISALQTRGSVQKELLACQVEFATPVCQHRDEALEHLASFRQRLLEATKQTQMVAVGLGAAPIIPEHSAQISDNDRYQKMGQDLAGIVAEQYVSGLHIHVSIPNREAGVVAMNTIRPWLPLLVALGANSPVWRAMDTGFASWRTIHYRRWSIQGIPPYFEDAADYAARLKRMVSADALFDNGHIGWAARLSENWPTIEVRLADAQLRGQDSVLLALLVRGIIDTAVRDLHKAPELHPEILDLAFWQGAKHGVRGNQIDPWSETSVSLESHVAKLLQIISPALRKSGDLDYVETRLHSMLDSGNGAVLQRQAFAEGSITGLLTAASLEMAL